MNNNRVKSPPGLKIFVVITTMDGTGAKLVQALRADFN
jgi:hypothetical protein